MAHYSVYLAGVAGVTIGHANCARRDVYKIEVSIARCGPGNCISAPREHPADSDWAFDARHAKRVSSKPAPPWRPGGRVLPLSGTNGSNLRRDHLSWLSAETIHAMEQEGVYWNRASRCDLRRQPCIPRQEYDAHNLRLRLSLWIACPLAGQSSTRDDGPLLARWSRRVTAGGLRS